MGIRVFRGLSAFAAVLTLAACGEEQPAAPMAPPEASEDLTDDLGQALDCLLAQDKTIVSAHRGGARPGYPENALETLQYTAARHVRLLEIDVAETSDGVLVLMHDDRLERTTTGTGPVDERPWSLIRGLRLKDPVGAETDFHPPRLTDVLDWAKDRVFLQIDFKPSARYEDVIAAVRAADMADEVIYIAYTRAQARRLARLAPESLISVSIDTPTDLAALEEIGVQRRRMAAWTGREAPNSALYDVLNTAGVPVIFGTLGGRDSIDRHIAERQDWERYEQIADMGVQILATDAPLKAREAIRGEAVDSVEACLLEAG